MEKPNQIICNNIRIIRNALKMTNKEFGKKIKACESNVEKMQNGSRVPTIETKQYISELCGLPVFFLESYDLSKIPTEVLEHIFYKERTISLPSSLIGLKKNLLFCFLDKKTSTSESFNLAIEELQLIYEKTSEFHSESFSKFITLFVSSFDDDGVEEGLVNASSVIILNYCYDVLKILNMDVSVFVSNSYSILDLSNCFEDCVNKIPNISKKTFNEVLAEINTIFFNKYNELISELTIKLFSSKEYYDFGYYFLAVQYYLGIVEYTNSVFLNREFGISLLLKMAQAGNKYAKNFFGLE